MGTKTKGSFFVVLLAALCSITAAARASIVYDLGTFGGSTSVGLAINDAGQVAGYSAITGNATSHAFRYDGTPGAGGIMRDLGTFGGPFSRSNAVNSWGQVAGDSQITGISDTHAFR